MRYVLDCSVAIKWSVPEVLTEEAIQVLDGLRSGSVSLVAPEIILAEFGHTVRKRVGAHQLTRDEAEQVWEDFLSLSITTVLTAELARSAFPLALDHMATFYDALYVALAQREDLKVLTADDRMVNAFAPLGRTIALGDLRI